jgi:transcription initiation factor TFIID subunit 2
MDLSSARAKLAAGGYSSKTNFVEDIQLLIENCKLYNLNGSEVYKTCEAFEAFFNKSK